MSKSITLTRIYEFPIEEVWEALTNPEAMSEWLMPCDFKPEIGHKFQFKTKPYPGFNGITDCEVLELEENKLLSFSWNGGSLKNTIVTFRLSSEGGSTTKLEFEHSGFEGFVNSVIVRRILSNGWKKKILTVQLQKYLENE